MFIVPSIMWIVKLILIIVVVVTLWLSFVMCSLFWIWYKNYDINWFIDKSIPLFVRSFIALFFVVSFLHLYEWYINKKHSIIHITVQINGFWTIEINCIGYDDRWRYSFWAFIFVAESLFLNNIYYISCSSIPPWFVVSAKKRNFSILIIDTPMEWEAPAC